MSTSPAVKVHIARLEADLAAAREQMGRLRIVLTKVHDLIEYREHAFGQPEVELGNYLKSLHDWLPDACAILAPEEETR